MIPARRTPSAAGKWTSARAKDPVRQSSIARAAGAPWAAPPINATPATRTAPLRINCTVEVLGGQLGSSADPVGTSQAETHYSGHEDTHCLSLRPDHRR